MLISRFSFFIIFVARVLALDPVSATEHERQFAMDFKAMLPLCIELCAKSMFLNEFNGSTQGEPMAQGIIRNVLREYKNYTASELEARMKNVNILMLGLNNHSFNKSIPYAVQMAHHFVKNVTYGEDIDNVDWINRSILGDFVRSREALLRGEVIQSAVRFFPTNILLSPKNSCMHFFKFCFVSMYTDQ